MWLYYTAHSRDSKRCTTPVLVAGAPARHGQDKVCRVEAVLGLVQRRREPERFEMRGGNVHGPVVAKLAIQ